MPEAITGALIGGGSLLFVGMLGAIVKLAANGRRKDNPHCPVSGPVASMRQEMETFHPQLARSLERLADAEATQSRHLVRIATILDERMPTGGAR